MTSHGGGPRPDVPALVESDMANGWPDRFSAWVDDRLTRVGLTSSFQRDCALAVAVVLASTVLLLVLFADSGEMESLGFGPFHMAAVFVVMTAQALLLCIRRVNPVLCLAVVAVLQVALIAVLPVEGAVRGFAPFVAAYTCGVLLPVRRAVRVVTGVAVFETAGFVVTHFVPGLTMAAQLGGQAPDASWTSAVWLAIGQLVSSVLTYAAAAAVGAYAATRRQYVELLRVRAAEAIESQRARADAAIGLERSRMARELHDIAAHHLSGMVVQTAVVERLIDRDPQAAKDAAAWIRAQGKETLHNLRLVVGTLREPGQGDARGDAGVLEDGGAPVPGLAVLDRLLGTARELGTPVEFVQEGDRRELPPIADVTFYRVAQEALANARDHAPGAPARVLLRFLGSEVSLDVVTDAGPPRDTATPPRGHRGFGLVGMKERAQVIGATFDAGPTPFGGWRVSLALPVDRETPEAAALRAWGTSTGGTS
ncbi:sensor histidine kinase [Pseudonocardia xinjiangensis]|uniref:sensor histidine kinase n=1 Tax=Pseudonocardia xinjiangensis TaxID=75289 RepID=UPI003D8AB0C6